MKKHLVVFDCDGVLINFWNGLHILYGDTMPLEKITQWKQDSTPYPTISNLTVDVDRAVKFYQEQSKK